MGRQLQRSRRRRRWLLALAFAPLATSGARTAPAPLRVVTTSADLASLARSVGGDRVTVESLASPAQDPHAFEVKPVQLARLRRAE
ncbi:MAG: zinc ABC transporter substrate-binding protein, partial [Burkholderiaceae bacterium]